MFARKWPLAVVTLALVVAADIVLIEHNPAAELAVEIQGGQLRQARVFFDTGSGFNDLESVTRPVAADSAYHRLFFPIPAKPVRAVRFDPLGVTGVVRIRSLSIQKPDSHEQLTQLEALKTSPLNEITAIKADGLVAEITVVDQADNPQLLFPVTALIIQHSPREFFSLRNLLIVTFFLLLATLVLSGKVWWAQIRRAFGWVNLLFDRLSRCSESSEALRFDRLALWFYTVCFAGFILFSIAKLHGSSISQAGSSYRGWTEVAHKPLFGTPKRVRSDEWSFHTPTILNQLFRRDTLAVDDTLLGPGKTAVMGNIPCRHFTQFFRPQFWAFFVLPAETAFSAYWQAKALLLLTGVFTLLLLLTRSSFVAALCALWFYFSAFTQWGYSWASLLPEMVGLFCWTITLVCYLAVGRNRVLLILSAVCCAVSAIDFALCAYPPHQLPLIAFGLAILAGWIWSRGHAIWRRDHSGIRILCLLGSGLITATVMIWFYIDAREALTAAAGTVYPGQRSSAGGGVTLARFLSHFLDFWKSEENFPPAHGNICESSGYLWLAPVTLLLSRPPLEYRQSSRLLLCCWTVFILLLCWALLPIPAEVGRWILFDRVPPYRCYHALGLINITIVGLFLADRSIARAHSAQARSDWPRGLVAVAILVGLLVYMNRSLDHFFSISAIVTASLYISVLILFLIQAKRRAFALCLLVPLIFANTLINPIDRGLQVITESALFKTAHGAHNDWRDGKWLIYAPWADQPGLLAATGIDVVDCLKIVPDKARMSVFDPDQRYADVINRSSYFIARLAGPNEPSSFESPSLGNVLWKVNPLDPRLKQIGVDHVAFASEPPTGGPCEPWHLHLNQACQMCRFTICVERTLPFMFSSTENAKSRKLVLRFFLFVLLLLPIVYLVSLVAKCGVNVPYADEFSEAPLLVKAHDHTVTLTDLFQQHNEHRYFFPRLLFIAFARLARGDLRLEMFFSVFLTLLVSANLWLLAKKTIPGSMSQTLVLVFLFNLLLFSPVQAENWTWGFQFPLFLCNFLFCCGLLTAASGLPIGAKFLVCLLLALVATFSFGGGVLLWVLTFPVALVLHQEMSWKSRIALAVAWGGAALGAIALYFFHYVSPPLHPTVAASRNPLDYFLYVTTFLGAHLSRASRLEPILQAVTVGSGLLVLWGMAVAYTVRCRRDSDLTKRTLPWLALGAYAVLNALLAAAARIGFGVNQALDSRYTSFSLYLGIAVIGLLAIIKQDMLSRDSGRRFAGISIRLETALLTAFVAFSLTAFMWGRATMIETRRSRLLGKSALLFSNVIPSGEIHDRYLMANAQDARNYANLLDSIGLLQPRMLGSAEILKLKREKAGDAGYLDYLTQSGASCAVVGWAILPKRGTPAHCVVLSYEDPKRGPVAFQIADETQLRTDVAAVLHNPAAEKSGWICHFDRSQLPAGDLLLNAWAFDANSAVLYSLGTPKIVH